MTSGDKPKFAFLGAKHTCNNLEFEEEENKENIYSSQQQVDDSHLNESVSGNEESSLSNITMSDVQS